MNSRSKQGRSRKYLWIWRQTKAMQLSLNILNLSMYYKGEHKSGLMLRREELTFSVLEMLLGKKLALLCASKMF